MNELIYTDVCKLVGMPGAENYLASAESQGRIKIIHASHVRMGNTYHDGNSVVVWKPIGGIVCQTFK